MTPPTATKCGQRVLLAIAAVSALLLMAACGSSSGPPPNQQGFSNSSLSGTYVFSFFGTDVFSGNAYPFAVVGQLTADGQGNFKSGTVDINDPGLAVQLNATTSLFPAVSATGNYSVAPDGRATGTISVAVTVNNSTKSVPFGLDFVLSSSSQGLITRFDGNGTGSGTIDLQTSGLTQASFVGSYGISASGVDPNFNLFALAGGFTLDASGNATGIMDLNDNGVAPGGVNGLGLQGGSNVLIQSPVATATFVTSSATLNFDVYPVSSGQLKIIEMDGTALTEGDAFTQQTSIPSGIYAYTMEGADSGGNPLAMAGFLTSDGSSVLSNGLEDYNDNGSVNSISIPNSSFSAFNGGRTEVTLNSFFNGAGALLQNIQFAAYPTTGGILLLENDNNRSGAVTGGTALPQGTAGVATSQGYALNLSGINLGSGTGAFEEDDIAQFNVDSNNGYKGIADINDEGTLSHGISFNGTLTPDTSLTGYGSVTNSNLFNFNYYSANNGQTTLILEIDSNQIGVGSFLLQQSGVTPAVASAHFLALRPNAAAKAAMKKLKNE
jgi:hypothetical protein